MAADESSLTFVDMYKAVSILGSGSFGMVLEAQVLGEDNTTHAVKIIKDSQYEYMMTYIKHEIDILSKLDHPNLLRYFRAWKETTPSDFPIEVGLEKCKTPGDYDQLLDLDDEPCTFIATEVCQSSTLSDYIKNRSEVNYQECKEYCSQLSKGLFYLHSHDIIHRDLKPANVLIGLNGQLKVANFGLAKVQDSEDQSHSLGIGTNQYQSPEMREGKKHHDKKTDIYCLGVIFAMLHSPVPIKDRIVDVQELRGLSDDDIQLLKKMLSKEPNDRPEGCEILFHLQKNSASSDDSSWFQPIKIVRVEGDTLIINAKIWQSKVHVVTISPKRDCPSATFQQKMKKLSQSKHPNVVSTIMDWEQTNPNGWAKKLLNQIQGVSTALLDSIDGVLSLDFLKLDTMEGDYFYTATEFCKGRTLQDFINENAQVDTRQFRVEAWKLIHGILEGLKFLVNQNIKESCLQPSNITISDEGIPKIGGFFGCQDGFYACPDIGSGADHLSDVYSLGVIAFQMFEKTSTPSALQAEIERFKSWTDPCCKLLYSMVSEPSVRPSASQILQHEVFALLCHPDFHGWSIWHNGNFIYTAKDYGCAQVEYNKPERPWKIVPISNGAKEVADGYEAQTWANCKFQWRGANVKGKVFLCIKEFGNYNTTQFSFDESVGEEVALMQINGVNHLGAIVDLDKQQTSGDTKVIQFRPWWFAGTGNEPNTLIVLNISTKVIMGETKLF